MMLKHAFTAVAAFGVLAAPLTAQVHQHTPPAQQAPTARKAPAPAKSPAPAKAPAAQGGAMADHAMGGMQGMDMDMSDMVCTMGMLPHGEMGGMGGGMGGMQHGAEAMGDMKHESMGGMKHEAMGGMKHESMGAGMAHPVTPLMLVHHAKDLDLSEAQVAAFTRAADAAKTSCQAHMKEAMAAHTAAIPMLNGDSPNLTGYEGKLKEATTHMLMAHMTVVKAGADARASLTAAQRQKLADLARMEHGK